MGNSDEQQGNNDEWAWRPNFDLLTGAFHVRLVQRDPLLYLGDGLRVRPRQPHLRRPVRGQPQPVVPHGRRVHCRSPRAEARRHGGQSGLRASRERKNTLTLD